MFNIRSAEQEDISATIAALGAAFAEDPLMRYFFHDSPQGMRAAAMEFFTMLLAARLALQMPVYVLQHGDDLLGAAMGYNISRPVWPAPMAEQWRRFETEVPGFAARLAVYEKIADACQPGEDHYYLGVLGVHPSLQGRGAGKALLDAFCARSRADPKSHGVFLETSSPASLQFYYRNGFELRGEGRLDAAHLWCVYKPN